MTFQKNSFFLIALFLISGLVAIYFGTNKGHEVSNYELEGASVTVIDATTKNNNFNLPVVLGCTLFGLALFLAVRVLTQRSTVDYKLTNQEQKIISLIKEGKTNKEIAQDLSISLSTVKTHVNNIYKGLGISSRSELLK